MKWHNPPQVTLIKPRELDFLLSAMRPLAGRHFYVKVLHSLKMGVAFHFVRCYKREGEEDGLYCWNVLCWRDKPSLIKSLPPAHTDAHTHTHKADIDHKETETQQLLRKSSLSSLFFFMALKIFFFQTWLLHLASCKVARVFALCTCLCASASYVSPLQLLWCRLRDSSLLFTTFFL